MKCDAIATPARNSRGERAANIHVSAMMLDYVMTRFAPAWAALWMGDK
jgi:hypothetical protein